MWMHGPFSSGFPFLMLVPALLLIFFPLFLLFRAKCGRGQWGCGDRHGGYMRRLHHNTAKELLDQRYVHGEIDEAQYLKMRATLE